MSIDEARGTWEPNREVMIALLVKFGIYSTARPVILHNSVIEVLTNL